MDDGFVWRAMRAEDQEAVYAASLKVHPDYFEEKEIFAERFLLYPEGCLVLWHGDTVAGYLLSHPWHGAQVPKLNAPLQSLPELRETYYLHDLALLPSAQGKGCGQKAVEMAYAHAAERGFKEMALVCVGSSQAFWERSGFKRIEDGLPSGLASYGKGAIFMMRGLPAVTAAL